MKLPGFEELSYKSTILAMIGVCQDGQAWRGGGGNMEEGLCRGEASCHLYSSLL